MWKNSPLTENLTLVMIRGKCTLVMIGVPPIFICENHRKINKIMHCVKKKKILSASFEDIAIIHVNLEIDR